MKMLLGGQRVDSTSGRTYEIRNPATAELIDTVPQAGPEDVALALAFARKGKVTMAALPAHRRSEILKRTAELIQQNFDCLLSLLVSENGKTLRQCRAELTTTQRLFVDFAEEAKRMTLQKQPPVKPRRAK